MKKVLGIVFALLAPASVFAQAPPQPTSPMEQALSSKLIEEINQNIQYRAALVSAQEQINALKPKDVPKK